jgi:hypothetical protein
MAKIPQGEWNAIAARYAKGESISKIARSYSCTPPAIHYVLKRNILKRSRQNAAKNFEQSLNGQSDSPRAIIRQSTQTPAASDLSHPTDPRREAPGSMRSTPAESSTNVDAPNALRVVLDNKAASQRYRNNYPRARVIPTRDPRLQRSWIDSCSAVRR